MHQLWLLVRALLLRCVGQHLMSQGPLWVSRANSKAQGQSCWPSLKHQTINIPTMNFLLLHTASVVVKRAWLPMLSKPILGYLAQCLCAFTSTFPCVQFVCNCLPGPMFSASFAMLLTMLPTDQVACYWQCF